MRKFALLLIILLGNLPAECQTTFVRASGATATIEIDAAKKAGYKIPRSIYGTFLEPIGQSVYGGLWAQELENPSFEENLWNAQQIRTKLERNQDLGRASGLGLPLPWQPLYQEQGARYEPRWNDAANSFRSLLIMALPGKQSGVRQEVHLPVHRILKYTGTLYAKHVSGPGMVEVSLRKRNHPETTFSKATIELNGRSWGRYEFQLNLAKDQIARLEPSDFAIAVSDDARVLVDQVFLFPADHISGMDPDMIRMSKALKTPLVRYGGNFTSGYHWRDGTGPMDKRVSMLNQAWGMPEYNHFGTDELLEFCRLVGAEPQIALNLGSGTPEEAADWVRYVTEHWGQRSGGLLWELGNELYGTWQIGYSTIDQIPGKTHLFSDAIRKVDPKARLIATGHDPDHFRDWNSGLLALPPGTFDFLATHFVVGTGRVMKSEPTTSFIAQSAFALPIGLERLLREMQTQIKADPRVSDRVKVAFTEWLFHGPSEDVPRFSNMGGAICAAGFLNSLMRVADGTPIANMTGLIEFGGIWKKRGQVYGVPAYWAFRMYSNTDATVPVEVRATGDMYDVEQGIGRIPKIPDVPYLDVVGALNEKGDRLTLFCVNRDVDRDLATQLKLSGFAAAPSARVQTLQALSIHEPNDETRPEAVKPVASTVAIKGAQFEYVFPKASVTVLEFLKR